MSDVIPRLKVVKSGSYQQVSGGVLTKLLCLLSADIRNVVLHGTQRAHCEILMSALREQYEPFGITLQFNTKPLYDTVDIFWPGTDAVTVLTLRPEEFVVNEAVRMSHDTHVIAITTKAILTTELLNLYDHASASGVHVEIFTTGYIPAGIVLLEPLPDFVYTPMPEKLDRAS